MVLHDILGEMVRRNPFRSQREACTVAARRSIAAFGPADTDAAIHSTCVGLAAGLFGDAYSSADADERARMVAMMEEEYRACRGKRA